MTLRKRSLQLFFIFVVFFISYGNETRAASIINPQQASSEQEAISVMDYRRADVFVHLSVKDFSAITGQKLSLMQKIFFKASQKKLKHDLKNNSELLITDYFDPVKQKFKLDSIWFILGMMIGPLAILFAFTSKRNKMSRQSAILGALVFVLWFSFLFII